jgi:hypothetical protein
MGRHRDTDPDDVTVEYVRSSLRDAAQAHEPDRTAMVNRIASGRSAVPAEVRPARRSLLPVGAALGVVSVLVASIFAVRLSNDDPSPGIVAAPPAPTSTAPPAPGTTPPTGATGTTGATGSTGGTGTTGATDPATSTTRPTSTAPVRPTQTKAKSSFVSTDGIVGPNSVSTWSENQVQLKNTKTLAELTVTITVAMTPGAKKAGQYSNVAGSDIEVTVTEAANALIYTYSLRDGKQLRPGEYLFGAQFTHASGRSRDADWYAVTARTGSTNADLRGAFA